MTVPCAIEFIRERVSDRFAELRAALVATNNMPINITMITITINNSMSVKAGDKLGRSLFNAFAFC